MHAGDPFVIPNPWDVGTARVLEALGFTALATTSSGFAFTLGLVDGRVTLDQMAHHVASIDAATDLPVSADLENGYGPSPADAAEAILRVARAGAVGGSIEDSTGRAVSSTRSATRRSESAPPSRPPVGWPSRSRSPPVRRTTSATTPTLPTRSGGSNRSRRPAPTSCMRRGWEPSRRSAPCATRSRSPSTFSPYRGCL